jgi:hypothetical protein
MSDETFTGTITGPFGIHAAGNVVIAQYHAGSDTTTFDWPAIEREAAMPESWCRGLAKILLAAREAGRET